MAGFTKRSLYHGWLPLNPVVYRQFLHEHFSNAPKLPNDQHKKAVEDFLAEIKKSGKEEEILALFQACIDQAAEYDPYADPNPDYKVQTFDQFLNLLDNIVESPPKFYKAKAADGTTIGEPIGVPVYLIFDLLSNTSAGYNLLCRKDFNAALKVLLDGWKDYLEDVGRDSNSTLNNQQWFSEAGLVLLESGLGGKSFDETYSTDSGEPDKYYETWDSFFTREFLNSELRKIPAQPSAPGAPFFIYNPCESTVFRTAADVQLRDTFWLKTQEYSLVDMLGTKLSSYADQLKGGSVLQSFLAPQDYHRWHSPIVGTVEKSEVINGTYYAVLPDDGAPPFDPDLAQGDPHGAMIRSQPWLSVAATRAVFILRPAKESPIELVAFIAIGMVEVSSCDITKETGDVEVGDELGMFHFGGSSFTLVVKPKAGKKVVFQDIYSSPCRPGQHRWIHTVVAQIWENH